MFKLFWSNYFEKGKPDDKSNDFKEGGNKCKMVICMYLTMVIGHMYSLPCVHMCKKMNCKCEYKKILEAQMIPMRPVKKYNC